MALRILMMADVSDDLDRGAAGTEVQTMHALRSLGHDVDAIWAEDLGRRIVHGNLHALFELPRSYERAAVAALEGQRYDIVHVNQPHGYRAARAVHRRSPGTIFIHRSHGFEPHVEASLDPWRSKFDPDERPLLRRAASRVLEPLIARHSHAIARLADGHVLSASLDAKFMARNFHVDPSKIAVIPQAAPDAYLRDASETREGRLKRVLYVGQFAFVKAPMITAGAMNRIADADPDARFTWVCDRSHHDSVLALLTASVRARMTLQPWTTQEELRRIYDEHGVFLFPSFFEGFGKAFLEAMSRGLCVIASDTGGMHDVVEHGRNGVLVPVGNAEALADAALAIMRAPDRALAMSAAAVSTARAYTWERVARELATFYQSRIEARR